MKASFDWIRLRMDLLTELLGLLSGTIDKWNTFISQDGDVGYFSDLDEFPSNSLELAHSGQLLRSIKQDFERLENYQQGLLLLKESLSSDFRTVR